MSYTAQQKIPESTQTFVYHNEKPKVNTMMNRGRGKRSD